MSALRPVTVEIIAYTPVAFFHCMHCEVIWQHAGVGVRARDRREQLESSLPADLQAQYQQLSDWARAMAETHPGRLKFRVVDAASVEGWIECVRHGVRRFPAVIVDGEKSVGAAFEHATALIERRLAVAT